MKCAELEFSSCEVRRWPECLSYPQIALRRSRCFVTVFGQNITGWVSSGRARLDLELEKTVFRNFHWWKPGSRLIQQGAENHLKCSSAVELLSSMLPRKKFCERKRGVTQKTKLGHVQVSSAERARPHMISQRGQRKSGISNSPESWVVTLSILHRSSRFFSVISVGKLTSRHVLRVREVNRELRAREEAKFFLIQALSRRDLERNNFINRTRSCVFRCKALSGTNAKLQNEFGWKLGEREQRRSVWHRIFGSTAEFHSPCPSP